MKIYVTTQAEWNHAESMMQRLLYQDPAFACVDYEIDWSDFECCHVDNVDEYQGAKFLTELNSTEPETA